MPMPIRIDRRKFLAAGAVAAALSSTAGVGRAAGALRAGAAVSNITPPLTLPISGIILQGGPPRHIHDDLFARALVLESGQTRIAIVVCDSRMIGRDVCDRAKSYIQDETGVPADHVLISATHSHSVPTPVQVVRGTPGWPDNPEALEEYKAFLARRIADGVRRAINQLEPAEIGWAAGSVPDEVYNRRWYVQPDSIPANPFGRKTDRVQMNPPAASPVLIRPAGPTDPELPIVAVRSLSGRPIGLLANYALHYVGGIPAGEVSADYFGVFAREVSRLLQADHVEPAFVAMMSNGTSGDVNGIDFRKKRQAQPPYSRMHEVGRKVAAEAVRVYQSLHFRREVPISMRQVVVPLGVRLPTPADLEWAQAVLEKTTASERLTRTQVYAREAVLMARSLPPTYPTILQAIRVGETGIAAIPSEVFAETGLEIKSRSPLARTFTIELANDYTGYLPTPRQHELGGYETWPARSSFLAVDAAPRMVEALIAMFSELHTAPN